MKTAKLFQVVNSESEDVALFQSTNTSIDDERAEELIKEWFENNSDDDSELEYFGIYRVFVNIIDVD